MRPDEIPDDLELDEERLERHEDGSVTFTLYYPPKVAFKGPDGPREETVETLTFRRLTAEDLAATEKARSDMAVTEVMFTRLTGIDKKTFGKLDGYDLMCGGVIIAGFTAGSQRTGDPS